MVISTGDVAWPAPSHAKTDHDGLRLPDGRKVGEVPAHALTALLVDGLGIPGASHSSGRASNVAAYATFLQKIHNDAGRAAVAAWLQERAPR